MTGQKTLGTAAKAFLTLATKVHTSTDTPTAHLVHAMIARTYLEGVIPDFFLPYPTARDLCYLFEPNNILNIPRGVIDFPWRLD